MDNLSQAVISKIKRNIAHNNRRDLEKYGIKGTLTYDEFIEKIKKQSNKCYVCLQEFQYNGGQWCYFFPSADRIYNYSPHNKENIGVSCNIRMFKNVSEKKCGLCEGLDHVYNGDIITKSKLFNKLGNDNRMIKEYIDRLHGHLD